MKKVKRKTKNEEVNEKKKWKSHKGKNKKSLTFWMNKYF